MGKLVKIRKHYYVSLIVALCAILFVQAPPAHSQQTIINVPSSEVLPAGDIILKQSNRFSPFSPDSYVNLTPTATIGLGHNMQFSSGVATSLSNNHSVRADIALNKVWFLGKSTRLTLGGNVSPYLNKGNHPDTFFYTHVSQRIKETKTSLTAGMFVGGTKGLPDQPGVLLGVEQVLIPNKLRFAMDWMSSNENYGRMGVGFKYRPVPTLSITSAVVVPNNDDDNIGFNISIYKFIALDETNPIKRRLTNVD